MVDDIANMPPRNRLFIPDQPIRCPSPLPMPIMQAIIMQAAPTGATPILRIFLNENSSPSVNMRKMTPISDHVLIDVVSSTEGV